jgi:hypothetical protein
MNQIIRLKKKLLALVTWRQQKLDLILINQLTIVINYNLLVSMVHCYFNEYMYYIYTAHLTFYTHVFIFHSKVKKGCVFNCLWFVKGYVISDYVLSYVNSCHFLLPYCQYCLFPHPFIKVLDSILYKLQKKVKIKLIINLNQFSISELLQSLTFV